MLTWHPAGDVPAMSVHVWGYSPSQGVVRSLLATGTVLESTAGMFLQTQSDICLGMCLQTLSVLRGKQFSESTRTTVSFKEKTMFKDKYMSQNIIGFVTLQISFAMHVIGKCHLDIP